MKVNLSIIDEKINVHHFHISLYFSGISVPGWNLIDNRYIYLSKIYSELNRYGAKMHSYDDGARLLEIKSSDDNKILEVIKNCKL